MPTQLLQAVTTDNSILEYVIGRKLELPSELMEYFKWNAKNSVDSDAKSCWIAADLKKIDF